MSHKEHNVLPLHTQESEKVDIIWCDYLERIQICSNIKLHGVVFLMSLT